jgi:hypothetical protein
MIHRPMLLAALLVARSIGAQAPAPPPDSALAGITSRGRLLAAYDRAAWHGTDAVLAKLPNPVGVEGFLAEQDRTGNWHVLFGRLSPAADTLFVVARADQATGPDSFRVAISAPPTTGSNVEREAFRAMRTAGADLKAGPRPWAGTYNSYVLPRPDGGWLVYFLPAQTQQRIYPHGGDFRYEVSPDGGTVQSKFQMHHTVLMLGVPANAVAGMHTVVTADLPQDSDVFLVLSRVPLKPELVRTEHFNFQVDTNGTITWRYATP